MRNWYGVDETRTPWCIITLELDESECPGLLQGWAIGDGNAGHLTSTEADKNEAETTQPSSVQTLGAVLDTRRYTNTTILTKDNDTIPNLRQALLSCPAVETPTLRGFRHISVTDVLQEFFHARQVSEPTRIMQFISNSAMDPPNRDRGGLVDRVELLWRVWTEIFQLVPARACRGESL